MQYLNRSPLNQSNKQLNLTKFLGRVGDRNPLGMVGSERVSQVLARRFGIVPRTLGTPRPPLSANWDVELEAARPELIALASLLTESLLRNEVPVTTLFTRQLSVDFLRSVPILCGWKKKTDAS